MQPITTVIRRVDKLQHTEPRLLFMSGVAVYRRFFWPRPHSTRFTPTPIPRQAFQDYMFWPASRPFVPAFLTQQGKP